MARTKRSPLLGYNHNVRYRGRVYHVQTEDSGPVNPHLFTHLYYEGTVVASKRHEYDGDCPEDVVRALMQGQHKGMLKELKQANFDGKLLKFFDGRGEAFDTTEAGALPGALPGAEVGQDDSNTLNLDVIPAPSGTTPPPELMDSGAPTAPPKSGPGIYSRVRTQDRMPAVPAAAAPPAAGAGVYLQRGRTQERIPAVGAGAARRPTPPPVSPRPERPSRPVMVQRQVLVGTTPPVAARPPAAPPPRVRRPAAAIPYVVREGSHPVVSPPRGHAPAGTLPPARAMVPPSSSPQNAPRTTAMRVSPPTPPGEPFTDRSLDEVIQAYLSKTDKPGGR